MYTYPLPLLATVQDLRADRLSLVHHIHALCDRMRQVEPVIHAFLPENRRRERLIEEAVELLNSYPEADGRPPLFGALLGVKDIFRVDGFPTQAGSRLPAELFDGPEAWVVTRLRQAGCLVAGKTVTTEFAYFHPGPTRNPRHPGHTPGGSSSGSAAAVAAGLCPLALGTQTIGSVIRPAAYCGIVGFKPSYDRIPTAGLLPLSPSLDHVGLFTQDTPGMALAASAVCRDWRPDAVQSRSAELPVLAIPVGPYLERASAEALDRFRGQMERLAHQGVQVVEAPFLEDFPALETRHRRLMAAEAAQVHAGWFARYDDRYSQAMQALIHQGRQVPPAEVEAARAGRLALRQAVAQALEAAGADLWACPAATGPAPQGIDSTGDPSMNLPWTHAGVPAITLPAEELPGGLSLGLQLVAPFGRDEELLGWATRLESML